MNPIISSERRGRVRWIVIDADLTESEVAKTHVLSMVGGRAPVVRGVAVSLATLEDWPSSG